MPVALKGGGKREGWRTKRVFPIEQTDLSLISTLSGREANRSDGRKERPMNAADRDFYLREPDAGHAYQRSDLAEIRA